MSVVFSATAGGAPAASYDQLPLWPLYAAVAVMTVLLVLIGYELLRGDE